MIREAAVPGQGLSPAMSVQDGDCHSIQAGRLSIAMPCAWEERKPLNAQTGEQREDKILDDSFRSSARGGEMVVKVACNDQQIGRRGLKA